MISIMYVRLLYTSYGMFEIETIDESSVLKSEIDRINSENERLRSERNDLRAHGYSQQHPSTQV